MMEIVVQDTNILIDLANMDLLERCRALDVDFRTTDMVIGELKKGSQLEKVMRHISKQGLKVTKIEGEELFDVVLTYQSNCSSTNLTPADWSVILLSKRLECRLLTSDQKLIRQAHGHGVETSGLLWLTDLLVERQAVTPLEMAACLQKLLDTNERAPRKLIADRLMEYSFERHKGGER